MPVYEVEFSYNLPEWGDMTFTADSGEHAEELAKEYVLDAFPDALDINIEAVKEVIRT